LPYGFILASGSPVILKLRAFNIEPGGFCQWANVRFLPGRSCKTDGRREKLTKHEVPGGDTPKD